MIAGDRRTLAATHARLALRLAGATVRPALAARGRLHDHPRTNLQAWEDLWNATPNARRLQGVPR